jgi:beta-aspartyl-peptidase (threonine type)
MARARNRPALVAHGGAGSIGPSSERPERRRAMMAAIRIGARILRTNGTALDAVVATVAALEDHPLFNAGYGSLLNSEGNVEMDASVMFAEPAVSDSTRRGKHSDRTHSDDADYSVSAGAVAVVSRVRNPIMLARAVMEHSPHILMAGPGAENFARKVGIRLVRPEEMVTERAR